MRRRTTAQQASEQAPARDAEESPPTYDTAPFALVEALLRDLRGPSRGSQRTKTLRRSASTPARGSRTSPPQLGPITLKVKEGGKAKQLKMALAESSQIDTQLRVEWDRIREQEAAVRSRNPPTSAPAGDQHFLEGGHSSPGDVDMNLGSGSPLNFPSDTDTATAILSAGFVDECDFLDPSIRGQPWADAGRRAWMDAFQRENRAQEELRRLAVEVRRVYQYLDDERIALAYGASQASSSNDLFVQLLGMEIKGMASRHERTAAAS